MATWRKRWVPDWLWLAFVPNGMCRPWLQRLGLWHVVMEEYIHEHHFSVDIPFTKEDLNA
jgi:hypothetical protein